MSKTTQKQHGLALGELCRALMVAQDVWSNENVNTWVDKFLVPRLLEATVLVTDDGRLYTRNGKADVVASISWTIFYSIAAFVTDQDNDGEYSLPMMSDFARWKLQEAIIDGVNERLFPESDETKSLVVGDTVYYEAFRTLRGGLYVPQKTTIGVSMPDPDVKLLAGLGFRRVIRMLSAAMVSTDVRRWMARDAELSLDAVDDIAFAIKQHLKEHS